MATYPESISVYRGHSTRGIGEGPGRPIRTGEQYIVAEAGLDQDTAFLDAVKVWLSFDAPTLAHQATGGTVEGWAVFDVRGCRWTARLASAGQYTTTDQRAAYFTHARGWRMDALSPAVDPGLLVGRAFAFASPAADAADPLAPPLPEAGLAGATSIAAEQRLAVGVLAHLLYGRTVDRPVVVVVDDYRDFAAGSPVTAAIAFARAALPAPLKDGCNIRTLTQSASVLLRPSREPGAVGPAALLVLHRRDYEQAVRAANEAGRPAILLDRQGQRVAGDAAPPIADAYARVVLQHTLTLPERGFGLGHFSMEIGRHWPARPAPGWWTGGGDAAAMLTSIPTIFALATAAAYTRTDPAARRNGTPPKDGLPDALLYLTRMNPRLPWARLLGPDGLDVLYDTEVTSVLSAAPASEPAGGDTLRSHLFEEVRRRALSLDSWLADGELGPTEAVRLLADRLVGQSAVVALTSSHPLDSMPATTALEVLQVEARARGLAHRSSETAALVAIARAVPEGPAALLRHSRADGLASGWLEQWANGLDDDALAVHADLLVQAPEVARVGALQQRLVGVLGGTRGVPGFETLVGLLGRTSNLRDRVRIGAMIHANHPKRSASYRPTMAWFERASGEDVAWAVSQACAGTLPGFGPEVLVDNQGALRDALVWVVDGAGIVGRWLGTDAARDWRGQFSLEALLDLVEQCQGDELANAALAAEVGRRLEKASAEPSHEVALPGMPTGAPAREMVAAVRTLLDRGSWVWWASANWVPDPLCRTVAVAWAAAARARGPSATLANEWAAFLSLLARGIDGVTMAGLVVDRAPGWPSLPGEALQQHIALARLCLDVGALAWLAEASRGVCGVEQLLEASSATLPGVTPIAVRVLMTDGPRDEAVLAPEDREALCRLGGAASDRAAPVMARARWEAEDRVAASLERASRADLESLAVSGWLTRPRLLHELGGIAVRWERSEPGAGRADLEQQLTTVERLLPSDIRRGVGGHGRPGLAMALQEAGMPRLAAVVDRPDPEMALRKARPPLDGNEAIHALARFLLGLGTQGEREEGKRQLGNYKRHVGTWLGNPAEAQRTTPHPLENLAQVVANYLARQPAAAVAESRQAAIRSLTRDPWLEPNLWKPARDFHRLPIAVLVAALGPEGAANLACDLLAIASAAGFTREMQEAGWWRAWAGTLAPNQLPSTLGWHDWSGQPVIQLGRARLLVDPTVPARMKKAFLDGTSGVLP